MRPTDKKKDETKRDKQENFATIKSEKYGDYLSIVTYSLIHLKLSRQNLISGLKICCSGGNNLNSPRDDALVYAAK